MAAESLRIQIDGAQIGYRRVGNGRPLLVLNGFAATSADWDPSFIDGVASAPSSFSSIAAGLVALPVMENHSTSPSSLMMPRM